MYIVFAVYYNVYSIYLYMIIYIWYELIFDTVYSKFFVYSIVFLL